MSTEMKSVAAVLAALADSSRLRIVMVLRDRSVCVCHITAILDLAASTVSEHLSVLKQCGLVSGTKRGKWVYYRLCADHLPLIQLVDSSLQSDTQIQHDRQKLDEIQSKGCDE